MKENKKNYFEKIAEEVIQQLQDGTAPWIKPWAPGELIKPYNPKTGNDYRGLNSIYLMMSSFNDPRWLTYRQASDLDSQVQKGAKSRMVRYCKFNELRPARDKNGKYIRDEKGEIKTEIVELERPQNFSAFVFNAEQIDGLPELSQKKELQTWKSHHRAEAIIKLSDATIIHKQGDRACYQPSNDQIILPERSQFKTSDAYYATVLHELGHWSGHKDRLNRDLMHAFGSKGYAKEELRAEIASLMLGSTLEIGHDPGQHASYIDHWVSILKEKPEEILKASRDAEKITQYMLAIEQRKEHEKEKVQSKNEVIFLPGENSAMSLPTQTTPDNTEKEAIKIQWLDVPYEEKNQAKNLGAKWDKAVKSWYAPKGVDYEKLKKWHPGPPLPCHHSPLQAQRKFIEACERLGLIMSRAPLLDGKMHRTAVQGDKSGKRSGSYACYLDQKIPGGYIQNWKTGEIENWHYTQKIDHIARIEMQETITKAREEREVHRIEDQNKVAYVVKEFWQSGERITTHPYLESKGIKNHGVRLHKNNTLMLPLRNIAGEIRSIQYIKPDGSKLFSAHTEKKGCFYSIGNNDNRITVIAEGFATGASIREATRLPVIIAFDAGNLLPVAKAIKDKYPNNIIIIAGDNDHYKTKNVGRYKAEEAAKEVNGKVIFPEFNKEEKENKLTDFNDLAQSRGLEIIAEQFKLLINEISVEVTKIMKKEIAETFNRSHPDHPDLDPENNKVFIDLNEY